MAIELFNGPMIYERLRDPNNRFRKSLAAGASFEDTVRGLYLAGLCRQPTESELLTAVEHSKARGDAASALEDICWALLNTDEFLSSISPIVRCFWMNDKKVRTLQSALSFRFGC